MTGADRTSGLAPTPTDPPGRGHAAHGHGPQAVTASATGTVRPVVTVAVVGHELVRLGVRAMLAPFADRVEVVALHPGRMPSARVDVVLHDPSTGVEPTGPDLDTLVADPHVGAVVLFPWLVNPSVLEAARRRGIRAVLPGWLDSEQLAAALCRVHLAQQGAGPPEPGPREVVAVAAEGPSRSERAVDGIPTWSEGVPPNGPAGTVHP